MADLYTKRCTHCNTVRPGTEFRFHSRTRDRLQSWCRQCENAHHIEYQRRMWQESPSFRAKKLAYARAGDERRREGRRATGWTPWQGVSGESWDIDHMIAVSEERNVKIAANPSGFPVT